MNHPKKHINFSHYKHHASSRTKLSNYGGVYPIPLYTKPFNCGGSCIYCPKTNQLPNSYIFNEDTIFAHQVDYSPERQLDRYLGRLKSIQGYGLPLEIIILGGSFSSLSNSYRMDFIGRLYEHLNRLHRKNLAKGSPLKYLCSILTVESRPDQITQEECDFLRIIGVSKVEIGVQHVVDDVLETIHRGHSVSETVNATFLLKSNGFKVGYHVMIGLPGSTYQHDVNMLSNTLWNPELSPDFLKIYGCELLNNRELQPKLWDLFNRGMWEIPNRRYIFNVLSSSIYRVPTYVRISRIMRQFNNKDVFQNHIYGVHDLLKNRCKCIRCREIGKTSPESSIAEFDSYKLNNKSIGKDTHIEISASDKVLLALARIYKMDNSNYFLREIHVYGKARILGSPAIIQGGMVGARLLNYVETFIAAKNGKTVLVNAAPGARRFFKKNGYEMNSRGYLMKKLILNNSLNNDQDKSHFFEKNAYGV